LKVGRMATTILVAIMVLTIQALTMLEKTTCCVPISISLMVLIMLIFIGFRAADENKRLDISRAALQVFEAGLMAYVVLSPITYEVKNASFVMAYIVTLVFCMACFDFEIEMEERRAKELK